MIEVPDNDIEYYERKVVRMEQDIGILQEELNRLRLRLRAAEDFEIKYHILLKNNEVELQRARIEVCKAEELKSRERVAEALKQNDEHWSKVKQNLEEELKRQTENEIQRLSGQLEAANRRLKDISQKKEEMELFSFKIRKYQKENATLQLQLADIKRACEKEKNDELTSLRNQLNASFRERLAAERLSHEARITSLTKRLTESEAEESIELNLPDLSNAQLVALKELYAETKAAHQKEVNQYQDIILRKNGEIKSLLRQLSERDQKFQQILSNTNQQLSKVEQEAGALRRQNQEEVLELTKRLGVAKEAQLQVLKQQMSILAQLCREKQAQIAKQTHIFNEQLQSQSQRNREEASRAAQDKNRYQKTIADLHDRLKQREDKIAELTSQINSQRSKQQHSSGLEAEEYQNGILFLQRQLRKSQQRNQEKSKLCTKVEQEAQNNRREAQQQITHLQEQLRSERKAADERVNGLENQVRELVDRLAAKTKEVSQNKKKFENEKHSLQLQLSSLRGELDELQSDYNRLQETRKQLEETLRTERERNSHLPTKRETEKNIFQIELEGIFRQKEEALLRKLEENKKIANDSVRKLNERIKDLELQNSALKKAYQRLSSESQFNKSNADDDKENKIATIQLQLARLNNIYQAFIKISSAQSTGRLAISRYQQGDLQTPTVSK